MVVTHKSVYEMQMRMSTEISQKIFKDRSIETPVSILVENIKHVNARLEENRYFYADIKKEGVVLYDSGKLTLAEAKELTPAEKKQMQEGDRDMWLSGGDAFADFYQTGIDRQHRNETAFILHVISERYITAYLLVKT